jgi:ribosomal protein S3
MYYKFNVYIYTDIINKYINTKMNSLYIKNYKLKPILLSNVNNLNAAFISNLICIRLKQNLTLSFVLKNIIKIINNITGILSYRIITTGKFTKKQRSTYIINNSKSVIEIPNSSKTEYIDYSTSVATTRYGICNIKVWLVYKMNYNIEELFKINLKKKNTFLNKNVI